MWYTCFMNLSDYGLKAYQKASSGNSSGDSAQDSKSVRSPEFPKLSSGTDNKAPVSVSKEIRRGAPPGHEPLVHKPVFENLNRRLDAITEKKNEETRKQAELAARTGTWFEKKTSPTSEDVRKAAEPLTSGALIKVSANDDGSENDSIYRRVAKFLVIIGVDEAAKILPHLTEEQTERIIPEIATIRHIAPDEADRILKEFESLVEKAREDGGLDTARTILTKAYGSERAEELINRSVRFPQGKPFEYLSDADADRIRILIDGETPAVQALVLSQLEPKKSAQIINGMEPSKKAEVVLRLAKMQKVAPEVITNIDRALHEKMLTQNTENSRDLDGRNVLAQILKRMDPGTESSIISSLSENDPELGADLRKLLFTEEDVLSANDRYLQQRLHEMEDADIALLIRGKSVPFREKILKNVSRTRGDIILEEESLRKKVLKSDCERVTGQFYASLRRAWERGELLIDGRDDGEIYV